MEFKDRLKGKRLQKGISQQKLADAIFVSRSAVAKWENGLGIPNEDSYVALLAYFELRAEEFPLNERTEKVSVFKNKKIRKLTACVITLSTVLLLILSSLIVLSLQDGFGFTSSVAVGENWDDAVCIRTPEYDVYLKMSGKEGEVFYWIEDAFLVKKQLIGYRTVDIHEYERSLYVGEQQVGKIYMFQGKNKYYYILPGAMTRVKRVDDQKIQLTFTAFPVISVGGEKYIGQYQGFFTLPFEMTEFVAGECQYTIR